MRLRSLHRLFRVFFVIVFLVGAGRLEHTQAQGAADYKIYFASMLIRQPYFRSDLHLINMGSAEAVVLIELFGAAGNAVIDRTIPQGGVLVVDEDDFPNLPSGVQPYRVIISASQPLSTVMAYMLKTTYQQMAPGLVSLFRGVPVIDGGGAPSVYKMFFGPVFNNSFLSLVNVGTSDAMVSIDLFNEGGLPVRSIAIAIPAQGTSSVNLSIQSVPVGTYTAVISSSQPLTGMAQNIEVLPWGKQMRYLEPLEPANASFLARAVKAVSDSGGARTTRLFSANIGAADATYSRAFASQSGGDGSFLLKPGGFRIDDLAGLSGVASGSTSAAILSGTDGAIGDLTEYTALPDGFSFASYRAGMGVMLPLPRLMKGSSGVGSVISIYNPSSSPATVTMNLRENGVLLGLMINKNVPAGGITHVDLRTEAVMPASFNGGGMLTADQPVTVVVDEFFRPPCTAPAVTVSHEPFSVIYPTDLVTFTATATGDAPLTYAWTQDDTPVGTNSATYSSTLSEGLHTIAVSVSNACGTANTTDTLNVSPPPCTKPVVAMAQAPVGVIYPTDTIHFTTAVSGSAPFTYAWSVDGVPDGTNSPNFDKSLPAGDHTVNVDVSNACGVFSYTRHFTVVALAKPQADLSLSTLNASTAGVSAGDRMMFIAVLRNTGTLSSPGSLFVNQIPGYTAYVTGSARASDGSPVSYDGTSLTWSGDLEPGSPVVITYEVTVSSQPPDNMIHNTNAYVYDHLDIKTTLSADVRFIPGFSLKINSGAVGTGSLDVELDFTYSLTDGLVSYQVSNNAAFDAEGDATDWLNLPNGNGQGRHLGWKLNPLGDPRSPRAVYVRFRKGDSTIVGPFMASILYDAQPPAKPEIEAPDGALENSLRVEGTQFTAITRDDNSGVDFIEVSQQLDFSSGVTRFPVTGLVTTFTWQPTGTTYVRAVDRSGNASEPIILSAWNKVYLPAVRK